MPSHRPLRILSDYYSPPNPGYRLSPATSGSAVAPHRGKSLRSAHLIIPVLSYVASSYPRYARHNNIMSPCRNVPLPPTPSPPTKTLRCPSAPKGLPKRKKAVKRRTPFNRLYCATIGYINKKLTSIESQEITAKRNNNLILLLKNLTLWSFKCSDEKTKPISVK